MSRRVGAEPGLAAPAGAMRECIVITRFSRDQPGFLDFSYRIAALARHYRVTVVSDFPLSQTELIRPGIDCMVLPGGESRSGWLRYLWECGRLLRSRQPHCAVLLHSAVAPVALLAGDVGTAVYWNEHPTHFAAAPQRLAPFRWLLRFGVRWLAFQGARRASVVMPIGEAHNDDLLQHGCTPQRVRLVHMGVDAAFDAAAVAVSGAGRDTPLSLIYAGTVSKARGCDLMLEALAIANRHGCVAKLTLVGAGEESMRHCRQRAQALGLADEVEVVGRVPGSEIPGWLARADAGLCLWEDRPWWRFNPPTKLFEYLVAGLPVLASDIRTHTAYITDGHNGFVFRYDSNSLAAAILRLWHRRADLPGLKRQARASGEPYMWPRIEPVFLQTVAEISRP